MVKDSNGNLKWPQIGVLIALVSVLLTAIGSVAGVAYLKADKETVCRIEDRLDKKIDNTETRNKERDAELRKDMYRSVDEIKAMLRSMQQ